jgi:hypothetical protein
MHFKPLPAVGAPKNQNKLSPKSVVANAKKNSVSSGYVIAPLLKN